MRLEKNEESKESVNDQHAMTMAGFEQYVDQLVAGAYDDLFSFIKLSYKQIWALHLVVSEVELCL